MDTLSIKKWQLEQRLAALDAELKKWTAISNNEELFRKHRLQIASFIAILDGVRKRIQEVAGEESFSLPDAREMSKITLGTFRIWEFLRSKLVQRREAEFLPFLPVADEFAWLCYQPVYARGFKQPPLTFLNGGYSPFTLTRNSPFQAESVPRELIQDQTLLDAMAGLPFPVIGVPWYQVRNAEEIAVVGHEVGHSVEADLKLDKALDSAIRKAVPEARQGSWLAWRSEVFADVYGCLGCGSAFVSTLADFLSAQQGAPTPEGYPPVSVRFRLNLAVLCHLGFHAHAGKLADTWAAAFPLPEEWKKSADEDGAAIAAAILDPPPEAGLPALKASFTFSSDQQATAEEVAARARKRSQVAEGYEFRSLAAAFRIGYDEAMTAKTVSDATNALGALDRIWEMMVSALKPGFRAGDPPRPSDVPELQSHWDLQAGDWFVRLRSGAGRNSGL
jgi:hypothetical protein